MMSHLQRRQVIAVVIAAVTFRCCFIFVSGAAAPPVAWGDDSSYDYIATQLLTAHHYLNTWYPPGYPLFLMVIFALFGHNLIAVRLIQAVLGAGACLLTYILGRRLFSENVGLLAAALLAFYPGHVYMSWRIMAEPVFLLLLLCSAILAVQFVEKPRPGRAIALAVALGMATLFKSNMAVLPPLLIIWLAFTLRGTWKAKFQSLLLFSAFFASLAVVTPIANALSSKGDLDPLPGNAGRTLWYSNNPIADGYYIKAENSPEGRAFISQHGFAQQLAVATDLQKDRIYRRLALLWIRENPKQFLILSLKKLNNAFGMFPHAAVFESRHQAEVIHLLSYGLLAPLAFMGLIASFQNWRAYSLLYIILGSYIIMVLGFYGTPRFTVIIVPYLILFATHAIISCLERFATRKRAESKEHTEAVPGR